MSSNGSKRFVFRRTVEIERMLDVFWSTRPELVGRQARTAYELLRLCTSEHPHHASEPVSPSEPPTEPPAASDEWDAV